MFKKKSLLLIVVLFVFGMSKISMAMMCGGDSEHGGHSQAANTSSHETANVGNKVCPVSGEKIGQNMSPATYEYNGKTYNLCCASCMDEFKKEPGKYVKKAEKELNAGSGAPCGMHSNGQACKHK